MTWVVLLVGILLGAALGAWVALWHRDHIPYGHEQLLQYAYPFIDQRIGATNTENIRRANRRFHVRHPHPTLKRPWRVLWFLLPGDLRQVIANYYWPEVKLARDGNPLPEAKRIGRYIQLEMRGDATFAKPYRVWNIQAVTVWPTSEVDVHVHGFVASLTRWVAWMLRLTGPDQLEVEAHPELGYWRFARKEPEPEFQPRVPMGVNAVDA